MIVLSRKRILLSLGVLIITIFTFTIQTAKINEVGKTTQTVAFPVSNKVIVLDARTWQTR